MAKVIDWQKEFDFMRNFCKTKGWEIKFCKNDKVEMVSGVISINGRRSKKNQYYILLHEIGHLILYNSPSYSSTFGTRRADYSSLTYKIGVLEEEVAAWNEGEKIAKKYNRAIDKDFNVIKAKLLATYCLWVNHRKHPHPWFQTGKRANKENENTNENRTTNNPNQQRDGEYSEQ